MEENPLSHSWEGFASPTPQVTDGTDLHDLSHESLIGCELHLFSSKVNVSNLLYMGMIYVLLIESKPCPKKNT